MSENEYCMCYEIFTGEEGWYIYWVAPPGSTVSAIRESGPHNKEEAEKRLLTLNQ